MPNRRKLNAESELERAGQVPAPELERRISALIELFSTRTHAASVAGMSTDQLIRYERGGTPSFAPLVKLAAAKGVSLDWLATGIGPMIASETAPQRLSHPARLDAETMRSALKLLTWAFELQGAVFDPLRDPDLLIETYAFLDEHGGSVTPDNLVDFSKRLAERRAQEALRAKQGGSGSVPGGGDPESGKK